jgi:stage V sporulation protein G
MEITEVRIFLKNEERLKAYASITFDDAFVVRNLKVINGKKGMFVSMPNRKTKDGEYKDVAHPVNNDMRDTIESRVMEAYNLKFKEAEATGGVKDTPSSFGEFI